MSHASVSLKLPFLIIFFYFTGVSPAFQHTPPFHWAKMSITSDEVNFLVYRYLQESGSSAQHNPSYYCRVLSGIWFWYINSFQTQNKHTTCYFRVIHAQSHQDIYFFFRWQWIQMNWPFTLCNVGAVLLRCQHALHCPNQLSKFSLLSFITVYWDCCWSHLAERELLAARRSTLILACLITPSNVIVALPFFLYSITVGFVWIGQDFPLNVCVVFVHILCLALSH